MSQVPERSVADPDPERQEIMVVPLAQDLATRAHRPFDVTAKKRCYILDPGPPKILKEIDCGTIIIMEDQKLSLE